MSEPLRIAVLAVAALAVFSVGIAIGQRSAPQDDRSVEQTLLASIDLAKAVDHLGDRELRLSRVTVAPNGHIRLHSHNDDPTVVYLISGTLTKAASPSQSRNFQPGTFIAPAIR